jgi:Zn-dependent peptidase ImmA (M78 family)
MVFNVFGLKVKLVIEHGLTNKTNYVGYFCQQKNKIAIDDSLKGFDLKQTVWHEFFHAVFFRCGFYQAKIPIETQELLVENFATAVVENGDLLKKYL